MTPRRFARMLFACALAAWPLSCNVTPPLPIGSLPLWNANDYPWPMFGQNLRRTSRSPFNGPTSATPGHADNWSYEAVGAAALNIQAVVSGDGVYVAGWGVLRRDSAESSPETWDKADGRVYGLHLDKRDTPAEQELFAPSLPDITPAGYMYPGRAKLPRDEFWVGDDNDYLVSFYNGTIEGTPCQNPADGTLYVGRGDGRLFAVDPTSGDVTWSFRTFNPERPDDPDGGGEIVGGPLLGADDRIYFGTVAAPWPGEQPNNPAYETNAVYCVSTAGDFVWRYPSAEATLDNWVLTAPALAPDGRTLYVATFALDIARPGQLLALDVSQPPDASDEQRLKWRMELRNPNRLLQPNMSVRTLAVGSDGRIYCAGSEVQFLGSAPVVFCVVDRGDRGQFAWANDVTEPQGYPSTTGQFTAGLALAEDGPRVITLFASTTHFRTANGEGGALFAIHPGNGNVLHAFDPATLDDPGVGGMTGPTLDASGRVYVGIRGKHAAGAAAAVNGRMYGLDYSDAAGFSLLWQFEATGQLDWVPPAIGANGGLYFGTTAVVPGGEISWFAPDATPPNRSPRFHAIFE